MLSKTFDIIKMPEYVQVHENSEDIGNNQISINYISIGKTWNQREIIVGNILVYNIVLNVMHENEDLKLRIVEKCLPKKK